MVEYFEMHGTGLFKQLLGEGAWYGATGYSIQRAAIPLSSDCYTGELRSGIDMTGR